MSDSSRRDAHSHGESRRSKEGFNQRNNRNSSGDRPRGGKKYGEDRRDNRPYRDRNSSDRPKNRSWGEGRREERDGQKRFDRGDRKFTNRGRDFNRDERRDRDDRGGRPDRRDRDGSGFKRDDRRDRGERRFADQRHSGGHQRGGAQRRDAREHASAVAREGYRPSRSNAPEIDTDVTGKELDFGTLRELRALEKDNAEVVARHLVMAGRYLDIDPAFALEHANAATRRAGRIAAVREAAGIAAYVAEDFELSLRELRTHRRISGSNEHLALLIDNERALGRVEKALELAQESRDLDLTDTARVEIALVVSGIRRDQGDIEGAIKTLQIPQLNSKRGYEYSPRLFSAYGELMEETGNAKEAVKWYRLAVMTEAALGQGEFAEPEIFDIFTEDDLFEDEPSVDLEAAVKETGLDKTSEEETDDSPSEDA
ncbi:hypothetical protein VVR12_04260 [Rothia sp. LK2588]|uniref:hypothetical protein n=1 Tax=Rothia sp. LK2588 TaxID=3114369 RepID=UPI0034CE8812